MRVAVMIAACAMWACGDNKRAPIDAAIDAAVQCAACADLITGGAAISCTGATDCEVTDRDNDGISDAAETLGFLDYDCDGVESSVDLPLPSADPDIPNIWLEVDYMERDLPASPRACVTNADCAASASAAGERNEQCFCRLAPDSCPSGESCDPRTRRCSGSAMTGHFCTHSHKPTQAALDMVIAAFQPPGVAGPVGSLAHAPIILTIDPESDRIPERAVVSLGTAASVVCPSEGVCPSGARCTPGTACEPVCPAGDACRTPAASCAGTDAVHIDDLKDAHLDPRRRWVYRYAVMSHHNTCATGGACTMCPPDPTSGVTPLLGSAGVAELPGNDMIVSLGRTFFDVSPTPTLLPEVVAGVLMHELGHTLNLHHGGHVDTISSPNYISVMNPSFQPVIFSGHVPGATLCPCLSGPPATSCCPRRVDYSHRKLPALDEMALDETRPLSDSNDITSYYCYAVNPSPPPTRVFRRPTIPVSSSTIDWNCDGVLETSVSADINFDDPPIGSPGNNVHPGARDWPYACPASDACDACGVPPPIATTRPWTDSTCPLDTTGAPAATGTLPCVNGQCQRFEYRFQCRDAGRAD